MNIFLKNRRRGLVTAPSMFLFEPRDENISKKAFLAYSLTRILFLNFKNKIKFKNVEIHLGNVLFLYPLFFVFSVFMRSSA